MENTSMSINQGIHIIKHNRAMQYNKLVENCIIYILSSTKMTKWCYVPVRSCQIFQPTHCTKMTPSIKNDHTKTKDETPSEARPGVCMKRLGQSRTPSTISAWGGSGTAQTNALRTSGSTKCCSMWMKNQLKIA